ncbi:hypothetical protein [Streptomyces sp. CBMA123]|nr:hypothetical protein [Streptomyces sp. CBMA123]
MAARAFDAVVCEVDGVIRFLDGAGAAALERVAVAGAAGEDRGDRTDP